MKIRKIIDICKRSGAILLFEGARVAMAILGLIKWKCRSQTGENIKP